MIFKIRDTYAVMVTDRIALVAQASAHWHGPAWYSFHSYGTHQHRSFHDASRWVTRRDELAADMATYRRTGVMPDRPTDNAA